MATSNAVRFLQKNGVDDELALKIYTGNVVRFLEDQSIIYNSSFGVIQRVSTGVGGKSHQFLRMARGVDPEYHTPGDELLGQAYATDEVTVTVDDILVSHHDVPIDQVAKSQFDVVAQLGRVDGETMAADLDRKATRLAVLTARLAAVTKDGLTVHNGGNVVIAGTTGDIATAYPENSTGAEAFVGDVAELARKMDEDNVPQMGRHLFISPYIRNVLRYSTAIFNSDFSRPVGNSLNQRAIPILEGFMVHVTNNLPSTNVSTGPSKYQGDFRFNGATGRPAAVALCGGQQARTAIGLVEYMGMSSMVEPDERRNTIFLKSQLMIGMGSVHPECAGEIRVSA